jgi:hypothetical protein
MNIFFKTAKTNLNVKVKKCIMMNISPCDNMKKERKKEKKIKKKKETTMFPFCSQVYLRCQLLPRRRLIYETLNPY